jgi:type 1 fimbriae regulatory protein FimB
LSADVCSGPCPLWVLAVLFAHIGELNRIADEIDQDLRDELRALRELRRQSTGAFVFASERGGPMTRFNVSKMVEAAGNRAGLPYAHPHMLRHTCGHLLADAGHDTRRLQLWLGHVDIKHTAHYSELSASPFKEFWK